MGEKERLEENGKGNESGKRKKKKKRRELRKTPLRFVSLLMVGKIIQIS